MDTRKTVTFAMVPEFCEGPRLEPNCISDYPELFGVIDDLGALRVRVGADSRTTSLGESMASIADVVRYRLMEPFLLGKEYRWERILSEDWKLVLVRSGAHTGLELKRLSRVIPMDNELESSAVELVEVRDVFAGLVLEVSQTLEEKRGWLRTVPGRSEFLSEVDRFRQIPVRTRIGI